MGQKGCSEIKVSLLLLKIIIDMGWGKQESLEQKSCKIKGRIGLFVVVKNLLLPHVILMSLDLLLVGLYLESFSVESYKG